MSKKVVIDPKIKDDLIDRCGVMPVEVTNLIHNKRISLRIYQTGIKSIKSNPTNTNFKLTDKLKDSILNKLLKSVSASQRINGI